MHTLTFNFFNPEAQKQDDNEGTWHEEVNEIPHISRRPVTDRIHATHKLNVFGFPWSLLYQKHDVTGSQERHTKTDTECYLEAHRIAI